MGMSRASHTSSNHHKIMKAVVRCDEISQVKKTKSGWVFYATDGAVFGYHPTAKAPRKLTSFLRQHTKMGEKLISKITSV